MKVICVFACWLAVVYGGVIPWTQSGEDYALNLYRQYCSNGDAGENNGIKWHCKHTDNLPDDIYEHPAYEIPSQFDTQKQVIFVQTPGKTVRHKVKVHGESGTQQETNIYVLPPKIQHSLDISGDIKNTGESQKPRTFFLKTSPGGGGGGNSGGGGGSSRQGGGHSNYGKRPHSSLSNFASAGGSSLSSELSSYGPIVAAGEIHPVPDYGQGHRRHGKRSSNGSFRPRKHRTTTLAPSDDEDY